VHIGNDAELLLFDLELIIRLLNERRFPKTASIKERKSPKKRGCLKSRVSLFFIRIPDGESFRLIDSQRLQFTFETSSFIYKELISNEGLNNVKFIF